MTRSGLADSAYAGAPARLRPRRRARTARRPDWWLRPAAALGWLVLGAHTALSLAAHLAGARGHAGMGHGATETGSVAAEAGVLGVMALAMTAIMLPLVATNVRWMAMRSPARHRGAVVRDVVLEWAAVWLLVDLVALAALAVVVAHLSPWGRFALVAAVVTLTALWQGSRAKRAAVIRCHAVVVPSLDRRTAAAQLRRFGVRLGWRCVGGCWALMLLMAVAGHALPIAAPLMWVAWYERCYRPHHDQRPVTTTAVVGYAGLLALGVSALPLLA